MKAKKTDNGKITALYERLSRDDDLTGDSNSMVKSGKKKFVRYQEGAELYSMGLHTFEELAREAGAIYKIRRVVLVNLEIFEEYLDTFRM